MFRTKAVVNIKTHVLCSVTLPPPTTSENWAVYDKTWMNILQSDRPQMTIKYNTYALHAGQLRIQTYTLRICNTSFPLQQWLSERATILPYTYIACLVITEMVIVYCAVRNGPLSKIDYFASSKS